MLERWVMKVCPFPLQRTAVVVSVTLSVTVDCNDDKFPQQESPRLSNKRPQHFSTFHLYAQYVTNAYINKACGGATLVINVLLYLFRPNSFWSLCRFSREGF